MRLPLIAVFLLLAATAPVTAIATALASSGDATTAGAEAAEDSGSGDIQVAVQLDPNEQSGSANAIVRIHASRETVWSLITSCPEALKLVPGLVGCDVLDTSPDKTRQTIRHVMNYSWYVPKLTYELRATYDKPTHVDVVRTAGDLKTLQVSWTLRTEGNDTVARYAVDLAPGFWVPRWLVRVALKRDLPKMLNALRARAEAVQHR